MTDPTSNPMDPTENPEGTDHLPVAGEVGVGKVSYHDPVTTDTDDSVPAEPPIADGEDPDDIAL